MKIDFKKFIGTLPYASELFGIYQPLIGWKSKLTVDRLSQERNSIFRSFTERALHRTGANVQVKEEYPLVFTATNLEVPSMISAKQLPRVASEIDSIIARLILRKLPTAKTPTVTEWRNLLNLKKVLNPELINSKGRIEQYLTGTVPSTEEDINSYLREAIQNLYRRQGGDLDEADRPDPTQAEIMKHLLNHEASVSAYLNWLAAKKPDVLNDLFYRSVSNPLDELLLYNDPLSSFGQNSLEAVLSPIGIVHLFRQYFFEFDTFLGPPVGHIWLSPGGTVELVEQSSRRTVTERSTEFLSDTLLKSEKSEQVQDELSQTIKDENRSDLKFGFSADANYDNGTFEASAHTDLSLENSRTSSRDSVHKQMREQSQRAASEIRKTFKSTFKTTTEITESSSRRYLLENKTNALVNYELRRKMRQIGVQVQDLSAQMCWQVFVDDPGQELGVAQLMHIAQSADLSSLQAPEPPVKLEPKVVELNIQFPYERDPTSQGGGETDVEYYDGDDLEHIGGTDHIGYNDKIFWRKTYEITPPVPGYTLGTGFEVKSQHSGTLSAQVVKLSNSSFEVLLHQVNFKDQPQILMQITTTWYPDPLHEKALSDAYIAKMQQFDAEKSRKENEEFLTAAKERITLASKIRERDFTHMREEERTMVYRKLIGQLMKVGTAQQQDEHVTSELIRAIFDVDKMLYFVAPEWWRVRRHESRQQVVKNQPTVITDANVVTWGGHKEKGRDDNYYITEESEPARMGSSLGWLLQLDGDTLRNAFLNSPWVKAVIPIRPGKERAALNWLQLANVAGTDGLDALYDAAPDELKKIKKELKDIGYDISGEVRLKDALVALAERIKKDYKEATSAKPSPFDPTKNVIPSETVYEHGFYPLQGSFEVNTDPNKIFSQWVEVLPTDQVVALDYDASKHI